MMTDYARLYAGLLSESDPRTIPKRQDKGPITQYHAEDLLRAPYDLLESGEVRLSLYYPAAKKVGEFPRLKALVCEDNGDGTKTVAFPAAQSSDTLEAPEREITTSAAAYA